MATRQAELLRVLSGLSQDLPDPLWVALVDHEGLVVSCVPADPPVDEDLISAMTAAMAMMGERVLGEIDGGQLRFASVTGANRQQLIVDLGRGRLLSIGLGPEVTAQSTFRPLTRWVPELLYALDMRFASE